MQDLITSLEEWNNFTDQNGGELKLHPDWRELKKEIQFLKKNQQNIKDIEDYYIKHGWQKLKAIINSVGPNDFFSDVLDEISNKLV